MREALLYLAIGVQSYGSPGFFQKLQVAPEGKKNSLGFNYAYLLNKKMKSAEF